MAVEGKRDFYTNVCSTSQFKDAEKSHFVPNFDKETESNLLKVATQVFGSQFFAFSKTFVF
jgi:hypothetical protein